MTEEIVEGEPLTVVVLGNFGPSHSTESHVALSLESLGHVVMRLQEGQVRWPDVPILARGVRADLLLWTTTYPLGQRSGTDAEGFAMLERLRGFGIPSLGLHLDRWWGLAREEQIRRLPFFACDTLATADGGHDAEWADADIRHIWSPPGVYHAEAVPGTPRPEYRSPVAFVGSHLRYHEEWPHRMDLVAHLKDTCHHEVAFWPRNGRHSVRGPALADLYASARVLVGDSCLVPAADGSPCRSYVSDRIPETLGRGGFLLHPRVPGVTDGTLYTEGEHLACWDLSDWDELDRLIRHYLRHDEERERIADAGRAHVLANHTYAKRLAWLLPQVVAQRVAA